MFSILLTTYTTLNNIDVYSSSTPRRPDSPDTGVSEKQPEKPTEPKSKDTDLINTVAIGIIIGIIAVVIIIGILPRFAAALGVQAALNRLEKGKNPCCIASSVIDTSMMVQVNFLRDYRENVVKKTTKGRKSLNIAEKIYYSMSPPIAKLDARYEKFRLITRTFWSGPIVSLLLCGMLLFNSGRKEFTQLKKTDSKLILKTLTMGIASSIFAISWIIWNCYLIISLFNSGILANIWQPAAGMLIGIVSLLILRTLYSDIPTLSDSSKH
ncbi:CFI-box-CTERM domain-containing protein [[Eubacterium] cellulosolvens]